MVVRTELWRITQATRFGIPDVVATKRWIPRRAVVANGRPIDIVRIHRFVVAQILQGALMLVKVLQPLGNPYLPRCPSTGPCRTASRTTADRCSTTQCRMDRTNRAAVAPSVNADEPTFLEATSGALTPAISDRLQMDRDKPGPRSTARPQCQTAAAASGPVRAKCRRRR